MKPRTPACRAASIRARFPSVPTTGVATRIMTARMQPTPLTHGREVQAVNVGGFVVVETTYAPSHALPRHGHEEAALCFAVRGAFEESVDGRTFECGRYDVMVRPAAVRHSNQYAATATRCVLIGVPQETVVRLGVHTTLFERSRRVPRETGQAIAMRIHRELRQWDEWSPLAAEGLVLELIGQSSRAETGALPRSLREARDFIHEEWARRPSLAEIAAVGGVHPATLVRAFRAHLHCSPGEYLRRIRLEHARNALTSSRRSIAEVALEAGFYDQSHFTAAFRRQFGITPAELRRAEFPNARRLS